MTRAVHLSAALAVGYVTLTPTISGLEANIRQDNADFGDLLDTIISLGGEQKMPNRQMDCAFPC
jgi:hypothetical protein